MRVYVLAPAAERDLEAIWEYIAENSPTAADRWIDKLFDSFKELAAMPGIGHQREDLTSLPVRFWPVGEYLVIYRVQQDRVEVVGVTQGARDVPTFLLHRKP